jgi:hypothetical protein
MGHRRHRASRPGPADPAGRGQLFAVAYPVASLAFSLPALAAGYATTLVGLHTTVVAYSFLVILIGLAAFFSQEPAWRSAADSIWKESGMSDCQPR